MQHKQTTKCHAFDTRPTHILVFASFFLVTAENFTHLGSFTFQGIPVKNSIPKLIIMLHLYHRVC